MITYNASISACEKASQWQRALLLLRDLPNLQPDIVSYSASISACQKAGRWQAAIGLLTCLQSEKLEVQAITLNSVVSSCQKPALWRHAVHFLEMSIEPNIITYSAAMASCRWPQAMALQAACDAQGIPGEVSQATTGWRLALTKEPLQALTACERAAQWLRALTLCRGLRGRPEEAG